MSEKKKHSQISALLISTTEFSSNNSQSQPTSVIEELNTATFQGQIVHRIIKGIDISFKLFPIKGSGLYERSARSLAVELIFFSFRFNCKARPGFYSDHDSV